MLRLITLHHHLQDYNQAKLQNKTRDILNSSPLEIVKAAVNPNEALKDRFNFGTIYYPEETSNLDEGTMS